MGSAGWAGCSSGITITGLRLIIRLLSEEQTNAVDASSFLFLSVSVAYQFGRGHPILLDVSLQISRQLQGHLTYFFPVGGFLMGWKTREKSEEGVDPRRRRGEDLL